MCDQFFFNSQNHGGGGGLTPSSKIQGRLHLSLATSNEIMLIIIFERLITYYADILERCRYTIEFITNRIMADPTQVLLCFLSLIQLKTVVSVSKYSEERNDPNNIKYQKPFRMNKINLVWEKAHTV